MPAAVPDVRWFEVDKIGHFGAYGALATAIVRIGGRGRLSFFGWWALALASAYGIGDEFRQSLTHGIRSPDWHDWVADTVGAATAVTCYLCWAWYRKTMETPLWRKRPRPTTETSGENRAAPAEATPH